MSVGLRIYPYTQLAQTAIREGLIASDAGGHAKKLFSYYS